MLICLGLLLAAGGTAAGDDTGVPGSGPRVEWVRGYGGWYTEEHPHAAIQAGDGGFVIVGESTGGAGSRIFVVRTDERGRELFARSYGAGRYNLGNFVLEEADGSFLVAGSWDAGGAAVQEDRVLLRLAPDGEVLTMRTVRRTAPGCDRRRYRERRRHHDRGRLPDAAPGRVELVHRGHRARLRDEADPPSRRRLGAQPARRDVPGVPGAAAH